MTVIFVLFIKEGFQSILCYSILHTAVQSENLEKH